MRDSPSSTQQNQAVRDEENYNKAVTTLRIIKEFNFMFTTSA